MKQVYPTFILNTNDNSEHPFLVCVLAPSDQTTVMEKVKQDIEDIDFSKGVLTYVDVDFSEYRKNGEEIWHAIR